MPKKIVVTDKSARRINISNKPKRRISSEEFAAALGAEPIDNIQYQNLDPLSLAAIGADLIKRLRSKP